MKASTKLQVIPTPVRYEKIKVLIIEDHQLYINGLLQVLRTHFPRMTANQAYNKQDALLLLERERFDLIIMDINLGGIDLLQDINGLQQYFAQTKVLVISSYFSHDRIRRARYMGFNGYLDKCVSPKELKRSVDAVLRGDGFVTSANVIDGKRPERDSKDEVLNKLSKQERKVMQCLLSGLINSQIAEQLYISVNTVQSHRKKLYKKLNVHSIQELTALSYRHDFSLA